MQLQQFLTFKPYKEEITRKKKTNLIYFKDKSLLKLVRILMSN